MAKEKSQLEDSTVPLLPSEIKERVSRILQAAVGQEKHPIRLLAIDFDATLCQVRFF